MENLTPEFIKWLHKLSVLAYKNKTIILSKHADFVQEMFKKKLSPKSALFEYLMHTANH